MRSSGVEHWGDCGHGGRRWHGGLYGRRWHGGLYGRGVMQGRGARRWRGGGVEVGKVTERVRPCPSNVRCHRPQLLYNTRRRLRHDGGGEGVPVHPPTLHRTPLHTVQRRAHHTARALPAQMTQRHTYTHVSAARATRDTRTQGGWRAAHRAFQLTDDGEVGLVGGDAERGATGTVRGIQADGGRVESQQVLHDAREAVGARVHNRCEPFAVRGADIHPPRFCEELRNTSIVRGDGGGEAVPHAASVVKGAPTRAVRGVKVHVLPGGPTNQRVQHSQLTACRRDVDCGAELAVGAVGCHRVGEQGADGDDVPPGHSGVQADQRILHTPTMAKHCHSATQDRNTYASSGRGGEEAHLKARNRCAQCVRHGDVVEHTGQLLRCFVVLAF